MPAFTPAKPGEPEKTEDLPADKEYATSTVSSKKIPLANLLTHVEGYPWRTEYYHQLLGTDDAPQAWGASIDPTLQQYHLIRGFEIRVQTPLEYDFTKERRANRLSGEGVVYPGTIIPIRGDMFIGDVGDGRVALFTLQDVTPMSYYNEKCYQVSYRMTGELTDVAKTDLENKVVRTSHYVKDFLMHGRDPVLSTDQVERKHRLDSHGHDLLDMFNREFIDPRSHYLAVPSQEETTFDPFVAGFIQRFINITQHRLMREANWPEVYQVNDLRCTSLWDLLIEQQPIDIRSLSDRITKKMSIVNVWALRQNPAFGGLYYSTVKRLLWPTDRVGTKNTYVMGESEPRNASLADTLAEVGTVEVTGSETPTDEQPLVFPVLKDDYYVFSESFYTADLPNQSWLEYLTTLMLTRQSVPTEVLLAVCDKAYGWGTLERYYYTPVLLMLIDYTTRGL